MSMHGKLLHDRCEILEDKINQRMQELNDAISVASDSLERRRLQREQADYLLDVSSLLVATPAAAPDVQFPNFVDVGVGMARGTIVDEYRVRVERSKSPDICGLPEVEYYCPCGSDDVVVHMAEAVRICRTCALCRPYLSADGNLSFNEEKQMMPEGNFAYQKINHWKELLAQIQAKQNTEIPADVINKVKLELKKQRITHTSQVDISKVSKILRSLKLIKYYEHANYICYLITGNPPLRLAEALENKLCSMFMELETPWEKYKPPGRHNFLSYHYTMYQMCKLLNLDGFLPLFNLLKSPEKMHKTNMLWKKICHDLRWQWIPAECDS